ncbi:hypothetical protein OXYTRIMIC_571 [Oxytricha trifallax]|uniref:Uncharacterized protein n=1 Tax=Oxytricha trifallax TaxID=1172189 RepID=A0A073I061_9SPIT|nr:hypothetical protein OXYTRIMIC_571 [Oxytricha trifallax]
MMQFQQELLFHSRQCYSSSSPPATHWSTTVAAVTTSSDHCSCLASVASSPATQLHPCSTPSYWVVLVDVSSTLDQSDHATCLAGTAMGFFAAIFVLTSTPSPW